MLKAKPDDWEIFEFHGNFEVCQTPLGKVLSIIIFLALPSVVHERAEI